MSIFTVAIGAKTGNAYTIHMNNGMVSALPVLWIRIRSDLKLFAGSGFGIIVPDPASMGKSIYIKIVFLNFRPLYSGLEYGRTVL